MKVSEITAQKIAEYLRLDEFDEKNLMELKEIAVSYVKRYTGREDLEPFPELSIAILILIQDMYDNRTLYVEKTTMNRTVESIIGLHEVNFL